MPAPVPGAPPVSQPNCRGSWDWGTWDISASLLNSSRSRAGGTRMLRMIYMAQKKLNISAFLLKYSYC